MKPTTTSRTGWGKDEIKRLKEEKGGMLHFDALILGGCKFYCLRKEGCDDITKCKGYKKVKVRNFPSKTLRRWLVEAKKRRSRFNFSAPK